MTSEVMDGVALSPDTRRGGRDEETKFIQVDSSVCCGSQFARRCERPGDWRDGRSQLREIATKTVRRGPGWTSLFFRDCGTGQPMVFVAPWALNSNWWEYQMADMAQQGIRCIAFDRRGNGRSDEPNRVFDFDTLADDLASVIEHLDLREITLVGQSVGCAEMVRYLSRHGMKRVARVVMIWWISVL